MDLITVKFFAQVQAFTETDSIQIPVRESITPLELWDILEMKFPGISRYKNSTRLARNCVYTGLDSTFQDGDEIALIPPVSGG